MTRIDNLTQLIREERLANHRLARAVRLVGTSARLATVDAAYASWRALAAKLEAVSARDRGAA